MLLVLVLMLGFGLGVALGFGGVLENYHEFRDKGTTYIRGLILKFILKIYF